MMMLSQHKATTAFTHSSNLIQEINSFSAKIYVYFPHFKIQYRLLLSPCLVRMKIGKEKDVLTLFIYKSRRNVPPTSVNNIGLPKKNK